MQYFNIAKQVGENWYILTPYCDWNFLLLEIIT
jgi:hypothetical protein